MRYITVLELLTGLALVLFATVIFVLNTSVYSIPFFLFYFGIIHSSPFIIIISILGILGSFIKLINFFISEE